jgi:hypothetical protein
VNSNWVGDVERKRYTNGYMFRLFGGAVSWMRKRQAMVTFSTVEVEYMETSHACKEAIWFMKLCLEVGLSQISLRTQCDSNSSIFFG